MGILSPCLRFFRLPYIIVQARNTGQLDTILTFYEITDPPVPSPLVSVPDVILRQAVAFLSRNGRAQLINVADGEGVRFFAGRLS